MRRFRASRCRRCSAVTGMPSCPSMMRSPAAHRAVVEDGARVGFAGGDRPRRATGTEIDRANASWRLVVADLLQVAVSELAAAEESEADAPTAHRPVVEDGARVIPAGCDGAYATPELDRTGHNRPLVVADRQGIGVAEAGLGSRDPSNALPSRRRSRTCAQPRPRPTPPYVRSEVDDSGGARMLAVTDVVGVAVAELRRWIPLPSSGPVRRRRRCTCGFRRRRADRRARCGIPGSSTRPLGADRIGRYPTATRMRPCRAPRFRRTSSRLCGPSSCPSDTCHSERRTSAGWTLVAARAGPAASRLAITMAIGTSRITASSASGGT